MRLPARRGSALFSRDNRFIWVRTFLHQITVHTPEEPAGNKRVILTLTRGAGEHLGIDLTALTASELKAFRETVAIATEIAAPIVERLDLEAQEAVKNGNSELDDRFYRPLPTVVVRKRALEEYDEELLRRRTELLVSASDGRGAEAGTPVPSGGVAEPEQEDRQSSDVTPSDS